MSCLPEVSNFATILEPTLIDYNRLLSTALVIDFYLLSVGIQCAPDVHRF
jgi:hypothetical protein